MVSRQQAARVFVRRAENRPAATLHYSGVSLSGEASADAQGRLQTGNQLRQAAHARERISCRPWLVARFGKTIAVLFTENATRAAGPLVAETPDEGVVSEDFLEQRFTLVDAATAKAAADFAEADLYVYEFDWSPDGKQLAITAAKGNGDDNWYVAAIVLDRRDVRRRCTTCSQNPECKLPIRAGRPTAKQSSLSAD